MTPELWENDIGVTLSKERPMTLGLAERQGNLLDDVNRFCDQTLEPSSVYSVLHRERDRLFPDEFFADLFSDRGRRSVPPCVVATVMVLQRLEGLSDREAVDRYAFDARWRYAAGVGGYDQGWGRFSHTVLVEMRARLAASEHPRRIFEVVLAAAASAGLVGSKRVLDSTPLYDAVATMDTITLIRSAIRALLGVAGNELASELWAEIRSGDDYATSAKPHIDWEDGDARKELIDSRAKDAYACLAVLDGRRLDSELSEAAELLATVVGQDLEQAEDGTFRIARRVAPDRVISTVDPEARHGHKTSARGFDGYKGHAAVDPDSEIITDTVVSAGNVGDAGVAEDLIEDLVGDPVGDDVETAEGPTPGDDTADDDTDTAETATDVDGASAPDDDVDQSAGAQDSQDSLTDTDTDAGDSDAPAASPPWWAWMPWHLFEYLIDEAEAADNARAAENETAPAPGEPTVYGDAAYGTGKFLDHLARHGIESRCKTQSPHAPGGRFAKDRFAVDLEHDTVTCPAGVSVAIRRDRHGDGIAHFAGACADCPLRSQCTSARGGRNVRVGRHEQRLADARARQRDPAWATDYRSTRPKVERKFGHLMRRKHGGRRARVRGRRKVDADFNLLGAAHNLARLAVLGLRSTETGWMAAGL